MYLKNCWYVAAWDYELKDKPLARQIIGEPIVLYRGQGGSIHALADACAHRRAPLSLGRVEGENIRCRYHGLVFGGDGKCVRVPGSEVIPPASTVRTYPVAVQDNWIWVWLGQPDRADISLVPRGFGLNDRRWVMKSSQFAYEANYMLINDNLCDLSHVDFVHEQTLGKMSGGGWSEYMPKVVPDARSIRIERWLPARPMSPTNPTLVDNWVVYHYHVPGIFIMETLSFPHAKAEESHFNAPQGEPVTHRVEQQAVTPISDRRTDYYFATGLDSRVPARLIDGIFDTVMVAFAEDREIIEAQQRIWDLTPAMPMAFIVHDKAPSMFRRIMKRLIDEENMPISVQA